MDNNTLTAIALIGYFAVIGFAVWLAFRFAKPKPVPWDGKHRLKFIANREVAEYPDDYYTGWVWKCSCGTGTVNVVRMAYTEAEAMAEFKTHEGLYK